MSLRPYGTPFLVGSMLVLASIATAQCPTGYVVNSDGAGCCNPDSFGSVIALENEWLFVGAPNRFLPPNLGYVGVTYVFHFDGLTWGPAEILQASDASESATFGRSIATDGTTLAVGAPGRSLGQGGVYVFAYGVGGWTQTQMINPTDVIQARAFGISVDVSGDYLVVGAENDDQWGPYAGAAYVYKRVGGVWTQQTKLTASDAEGGGGSTESYAAHFGLSVGIDGNRIVVGAHGQDGVGEGSGAAYVFEWDGEAWTERAKLTPDDANEWDIFGYPVSISGNRIVASAPYAIVEGIMPGVTYVFDYDGTQWSQSAKLIPSDAASGDEAIYTAIQGNTLLIGASNHRNGSDPNGWLGATYLFEECGGEWSEIGKVVSSDTSVMGQFGRAVAIDGNNVAIGAFSSVPGRVYTYDFPGDCLTPNVAAVGSRYISVDMSSIDPETPIAIEMTHDDCPCQIRYVDAYGFLTDTPTVRTASEWGTVYIADSEVIPSNIYRIALRSDSLRGRLMETTTWKWADTDSNDIVNLDDILSVLRGFSGDFAGTSKQAVDLIGSFFNPDRAVNLDDILAVLAAFSGVPYAAGTPCD